MKEPIRPTDIEPTEPELEELLEEEELDVIGELEAPDEVKEEILLDVERRREAEIERERAEGEPTVS
jgi:hypothetical protein